jgi:hypothetical protein
MMFIMCKINYVFPKSDNRGKAKQLCFVFTQNNLHSQLYRKIVIIPVSSIFLFRQTE